MTRRHHIDRASILARLDRARTKRGIGVLEFLRTTGLSDTSYYRFRDSRPGAMERLAAELEDCAERLERGEALPLLRAARKKSRQS